MAAASSASRWGALLQGCPEVVVTQFVKALVAEGLDPEDGASLAELSPQLLDTLRLDDLVAGERVLSLVELGRSERKHAAAVKDAEQTVVSTDIVDSKRDAPLCIGAFESRTFQQTDRRGAQAQEVVPGVFLGGFKAATNTEEHQRLGITHIVNATSRQLDAPHAKVLCLNLRDADDEQDISCHFWPVIAFLDEARSAGCAALVHCVRGVSRSSTLVCAYIIARSGLGVQDTVRLVQEARPVAKPRLGFMQQLRVFKQQLDNGQTAPLNASSQSAADTANRHLFRGQWSQQDIKAMESVKVWHLTPAPS